MAISYGGGSDPFSDIENQIAGGFGNHSGFGGEGGGAGNPMHKGPGPQGNYPAPVPGGTPPPAGGSNDVPPGTPGDNPGFFDQPISGMLPNPEPPENTIIRDLLTRKFIGAEGAGPLGGNTMRPNTLEAAPAFSGSGYSGPFTSDWFYGNGNKADQGEPGQTGSGGSPMNHLRDELSRVMGGNVGTRTVNRQSGPPPGVDIGGFGPGSPADKGDHESLGPISRGSFFDQMKAATPPKNNSTLANLLQLMRARLAPKMVDRADGISYDSAPSTTPWTQAWNGPFAAPISNTMQTAIDRMSSFGSGGGGGGGGFGGGGVNINMGGSYTPGKFKYDPYDFTNIQESGQTLKDLQDAQTMKELQSRAAAGGNALSGALLGQESDYLRGSGAQFENLMGQLRLSDVSNQRQLWNQLQQSQISAAAQRASAAASAGAATAAARMNAAVQNRSLDLQSLNDLFRMGQSQQEAAQNEITGQYGDFLRQGNAARDQDRYNDNLGLGIMNHGYPGYSPINYGASDASGLSGFLQQFQNGGGSGITDFISSLFNNQGGGGSGDGIAYDAIDSADYLKRLDAAQAASRDRYAHLGKASNANKAMTLLALLAQVMGMGKGKQGGGGHSAGSGGGGNSGGKSNGEKLADLLTGNKNPYAAGSPIAQEWNKQFNKDGSPKTPAQPMALPVKNDLSTIQKLPVNGGSADQGGLGSSITEDQAFSMDNSPTGADAFGHNEFDNLGGYNSADTPYNYENGPSNSLGWGDSNPNTQDTGGFSLGNEALPGIDPITGANDFGGGSNDFGGNSGQDAGWTQPQNNNDFGGFNPDNFGGGSLGDFGGDGGGDFGGGAMD